MVWGGFFLDSLSGRGDTGGCRGTGMGTGVGTGMGTGMGCHGKELAVDGTRISPLGAAAGLCWDCPCTPRFACRDPYAVSPSLAWLQ